MASPFTPASIPSSTPSEKLTLGVGAATLDDLFVIPIPSTYNTLGAVVMPVAVRVPAGWFLKLTVSHAAIGTTTYY